MKCNASNTITIRKNASRTPCTKLTVDESVTRLASFLDLLGFGMIYTRNTYGNRRLKICNKYAVLSGCLTKHLTLEEAVSLYNNDKYRIYTKSRMVVPCVSIGLMYTSEIILEATSNKPDNQPLTLQRNRKSPTGLSVQYV